MKLHLKTITNHGLAMMSTLFLSGFVLQTEDPFAAAVVERKYEAADLGRVDLVGVCSLSPDSISCWDPDGKLDPDLTEKVKAYYIVQAGTEIRVRFGRKTLLVAFKVPARVNQTGANIGTAKSESGRFYNEGGNLPNSQGDGPATTWYQIDVDPVEKTTSVVFDVTSQFGAVSVPLRQGSVGAIGKAKVRILSIKPGPERKPYWGQNLAKGQKTWTLTVTIEGWNGTKFPTLNGTIIDSTGQPVWTVDANGNPSVRSPQAGYPGFPPAGQFDGNVYLTAGANSAKQELSIPVNPSKVQSINLSMYGVRQVTFKNILLDPH